MVQRMELPEERELVLDAVAPVQSLHMQHATWHE
jgi:hypothetical protein